MSRAAKGEQPCDARATLPLCDCITARLSARLLTHLNLALDPKIIVGVCMCSLPRVRRRGVAGVYLNKRVHAVAHAQETETIFNCAERLASALKELC